MQLDPGRFTLVDAWKSLLYQDPADIASAVKHSGGMWIEATALPGNAQAATAAYLPSPVSIQDVAYKLSAESTIAPANSITTAQEVNSLALRPGIVQPNSKIGGAVWFERGKNLQYLILRVPVENQVFELPLSFGPRN
jgi:hypothetical protein